MYDLADAKMDRVNHVGGTGNIGKCSSANIIPVASLLQLYQCMPRSPIPLVKAAIEGGGSFMVLGVVWLSAAKDFVTLPSTAGSLRLSVAQRKDLGLIGFASMAVFRWP